MATGSRVEDRLGRAPTSPTSSRACVTAFVRGGELEPRGGAAHAAPRGARRGGRQDRGRGRPRHRAGARGRALHPLVLRGRDRAARGRLRGGPGAARALSAEVRRATRRGRPKVFQALDLPAPDGDRARRGAPAIDHLAAYLRAQLHALVLADPPTRRGDIEGVHGMRVATRRMRSALKEGRKLLDPGWVKETRDELKWLGSVLGDVRDFDVFSGYVHTQVADLGPESAGGRRRAGAPDPGALAARPRAARRDARLGALRRPARPSRGRLLRPARVGFAGRHAREARAQGRAAWPAGAARRHGELAATRSCTSCGWPPSERATRPSWRGARSAATRSGSPARRRPPGPARRPSGHRGRRGAAARDRPARLAGGRVRRRPPARARARPPRRRAGTAARDGPALRRRRSPLLIAERGEPLQRRAGASCIAQPLSPSNTFRRAASVLVAMTSAISACERSPR